MNKKIVTGALAALTIGGVALATATPASAQRWGGYHGGYYHHGGVGVGTAVGAGLLGLAVGASLADRPYYGGGYYAPAPYYAPGYYAPAPYYYPGYGYYYGGRYWHHWYRGRYW